MKGKIVLVTGANGGLGTFVTQAFLDAGAIVVGTSREIAQTAFASPNFTALAADLSTREAAKTLVAQVVARFQIARAAIPALRASGDGRLIAVGSRAAVDPGPGVGAYSASKAAMVSLIRSVALEHKSAGLKANAILPGTMDTPANRKAMPNADFSKWVQPASVASLMVWLASDAGRDVNEAVIPVYGPEG